MHRSCHGEVKGHVRQKPLLTAIMKTVALAEVRSLRPWVGRVFFSVFLGFGFGLVSRLRPGNLSLSLAPLGFSFQFVLELSTSYVAKTLSPYGSLVRMINRL